jgi:hypothetical protein
MMRKFPVFSRLVDVNLTAFWTDIFPEIRQMHREPHFNHEFSFGDTTCLQTDLVEGTIPCGGTRTIEPVTTRAGYRCIYYSDLLQELQKTAVRTVYHDKRLATTEKKAVNSWVPYGENYNGTFGTVITSASSSFCATSQNTVSPLPDQTLLNRNVASFWYSWYHRHQIENGLQRRFSEALRLESFGRNADALDVVFQEIDRRFREGDFESCDKLLDSVDPSSLSLRMIVGLLSITMAGSRSVLSRQKFYDAAWNHLCAKGEDAEELLGGLRGWRAEDEDASPVRTKAF